MIEYLNLRRPPNARFSQYVVLPRQRELSLITRRESALKAECIIFALFV